MEREELRVEKVVINHLKLVLNGLNDQEYSEPLEILNGSSIGQHCRHILEFFSCFCEGTETKTVDYELRKRELNLENVRSAALDRCVLIEEQLLGKMTDKTILEVAYHDGLEQLWMKSTVQREFAFVLEHAIHHLAIIKMALPKRTDLPSTFGIAPSTLRHLEKQNVYSNISPK